MMRVLIVLNIVISLAFSAVINPKPIDDKFATKNRLYDGVFVTKIDHFRPQDIRTVNFTYKLNVDYYQKSGPIFIYIGDGSGDETKWIQKGLMVDIASELHAALATADLRYFGTNLPTETASFQDLTFSTISQTLSDIAYLITTIKKHLVAEGTRVILWGSGYGAKLATYARQRYPHLVDGVWASSGLFLPEPFSPNYYNMLSWNLHQFGEDECDSKVANVFKIMEDLIDNGQTETLQNALNLCHPVNANSPSDIAMFFEGQIQFISDYIDTYHLQGLQNFCRDMGAVANHTIASYSRWVRYAYGESNCFDFNYANFITSKSDAWDTPSTNSGMRQRHHLSCTQIGYMKTTSDDGIFPNRISPLYQLGLCADMFGEEYQIEKLEEATRSLEIQFGSQNQRATKVVYTNGMLDPWVDHGITDFDLDGSYVINIIYVSRSADLESIAGWQSAELVNAKLKIWQLIREWTKPGPR